MESLIRELDADKGDMSVGQKEIILYGMRILGCGVNEAISEVITNVNNVQAEETKRRW